MVSFLMSMYLVINFLGDSAPCTYFPLILWMLVLKYVNLPTHSYISCCRLNSRVAMVFRPLVLTQRLKVASWRLAPTFLFWRTTLSTRLIGSTQITSETPLQWSWGWQPGRKRSKHQQKKRLRLLLLAVAHVDQNKEAPIWSRWRPKK